MVAALCCTSRSAYRVGEPACRPGSVTPLSVTWQHSPETLADLRLHLSWLLISSYVFSRSGGTETELADLAPSIGHGLPPYTHRDCNPSCNPRSPTHEQAGHRSPGRSRPPARLRPRAGAQQNVGGHGYLSVMTIDRQSLAVRESTALIPSCAKGFQKFVQAELREWIFQTASSNQDAAKPGQRGHSAVGRYPSQTLCPGALASPLCPTPCYPSPLCRSTGWLQGLRHTDRLVAS